LYGEVDAVGRINVQLVYGEPYDPPEGYTRLNLIFEQESMSSLWPTWELIRAYLVADGYYGEEENDYDAKIRRYWIDGLTDEMIAKQLPFSASTVKRRRYKLGLKQERKKKSQN
jgi:hypothetical protein